MKLVDILALELKVWPEGLECLSQLKGTGYIINGKGFDGRAFDALRIADETLVSGAIVTRAEWQAAVDALNQSELDAVLAKNEQLAAARAERIQAWNGEGLPPVGTICEVLWNESRMEYLITKVFGVNEHGQPIHRFDEGPKKYQYQADVLRTASGTQVFRPIRTDEQVAAEEREKAINEMMMHGVDAGDSTIEYSCAALYDAGYRKEPKPCGS